MVCLSCRKIGPALCRVCRRTVTPSGPLRTPGGIEVHAWARHEGAARLLVHRLKYEGVAAVAEVVASALAERVPAGAACLVPVPRTLARRVRYGIDPAAEIARAVARRAGLPVLGALTAPLWSPVSAGSSRSHRRAPHFTLRGSVSGVVLVDDVVTTGATLDSAATALGGVRAAVTITGVP